jgi:hypothetical protein
MEHAKRMATSDAWDCLPEEIVSLITVKVAETLEAPLEDLHNPRPCNKVTKRASSSHPSPIASTSSITTRLQFGGGGANALNAYLQIVDRLQSVNNRGALFVKRVGDICMGRPGGAALLTTEEEGDLQAS